MLSVLVGYAANFWVKRSRQSKKTAQVEIQRPLAQQPSVEQPVVVVVSPSETKEFRPSISVSNKPVISIYNEGAPAKEPPTCDHRVVGVKKDKWTAPIEYPVGKKLNWMPRSAVTYELLTADMEKSGEKPILFPKIPQDEVKISSLLSPWFTFRAEEDVVIDVYCH